MLWTTDSELQLVTKRPWPFVHVRPFVHRCQQLPAMIGKRERNINTLLSLSLSSHLFLSVSYSLSLSFFLSWSLFLCSPLFPWLEARKITKTVFIWAIESCSPDRPWNHERHLYLVHRLSPTHTHNAKQQLLAQTKRAACASVFCQSQANCACELAQKFHNTNTPAQLSKCMLLTLLQECWNPLLEG